MKQSIGAGTLLYPTPVWLIGSYDKDEKPNVMAAAWVGICCSNPPCVTVSIRKARYTYENIMARKAFTVNIPSEKYVKEADYSGIAPGRKVDKFKAAGLTPIKSSVVDAPYVEEFPMIAECKLVNTLEVGVHTMFIGEILDVKVDKAIIGENGKPDMERLKTFLFAPANTKYYKTGEYLADAFSVGRDIK